VYHAGALPDIRAEHLILVRQFTQRGERFRLALRLREGAERQRFAAADRLRNHGVDQRGARREAEGFEHRLLVGRIRADVPFGEGVMHFERGERERSAVHQTIRVFELHGVFLAVRPSAFVGCRT